jgi:hypothetical protein
MDCKSARLLAEFFRLHGAELEPAEAQALQHHLHDCPDCAILARAELEADLHLGRAMRDVPIPADLQGRLLKRLSAARRSWYRRFAVRVAAAAVVLLAVSVATAYWVRSHRPALSMEAIHAEEFELRGLPPDQVEKLFRERHGVRTQLPRDLNYAFLVKASRLELRGRLVPYLRFARGPDEAEVYVLSAEDFNLKASLQEPEFGSGGFTVQIWPHPADPDIAYLVEFTGGSLSWLQLDPGSAN